MLNRTVRRGGGAALLVGAAMVSGGCIVVSDGHSDLVHIEKRKAEAQYLAARAEIEKINLEREKAGLKRIEVDDEDSLVKPRPSDPELTH